MIGSKDKEVYWMVSYSRRIALVLTLLTSLGLLTLACGDTTDQYNQIQSTLNAQASIVAQLQRQIPTPTITPMPLVISTSKIGDSPTATATTGSSSVHLTPSPTPSLMPTALPYPAATMLPASVAQATYAAFDSQAQRVNGPFVYNLESRGSGFFTVFGTGLRTLRNFEADVRFFNPYAASQGHWSYGFIFRRQRDTDGSGHFQQYHFYVTSSKTWVCNFVAYDNAYVALDAIEISNGVVSGLDVSAAGNNRLTLIVNQDVAIVQVNDKYVANFALNNFGVNGDAWVASGFRENDQPKGTITKFENFSVYDLGK